MTVKILIVEDDDDVLNTLVEFLIKSGFIAKGANSAEEAEEILKNEELNIVLTDIKLPGIDGIKLTKNIKKLYGLDVIVMTGYSSEYSYADAIKNGASDLIFKPIKLNELLLRINRVIKERSLLDDRDKMIKQLKRLTIEDSLTGLYNSRHFNESFMINGREISGITSSIGIAEYQINEGYQQFVHRADVTMYEAKQRGGNGVIISPAQNELATTAVPLHS